MHGREERSPGSSRDQIEESTRLTATALVKQDVALAKLDEGLTEMRLRREVRRIKDEG